MATKKKLLQAAAGSAGGAGALDITDVFSTYLYTGTGAARSINNGIDLADEGGLVWIKTRSATAGHSLQDTERGAGNMLSSNGTWANSSRPDTLTGFDSNGFSLGADTVGYVNYSSSYTYASWSFRKAPKFFDVVTYTGDGVDGRTVSHNLGSVPGLIIVKCTSATGNWWTYHRSLGENKYVLLNSTQAQGNTGFMWSATAPTSTEFTLGDYNEVNGSGKTFVAYLFAHNDADGEFGPDSDQDIIKCGSYVGDGTGLQEIDLGFEPQWLMFKRSNSSSSWAVFDSMRGMGAGVGDPYLLADSNIAEALDANYIEPTPNGFKSAFNDSGDTWIYMAIRRGPLAPPEDATEVFGMDTYGSTTPRPPALKSGFPVDFAFVKHYSDNWMVGSRLTQGKRLYFTTAAQHTSSSEAFDFQDGWVNDTYVDSRIIGYAWKRAPGYFDVVCWDTENTSNRRLEHSLTVIPEMAWVKSRDYVDGWYVYHKDVGSSGFLSLNENDDNTVTSALWPSPSATEFGIRENAIWNTGTAMIGCFFATLDGISKVGSFTGNGSSQTINCGFTSGSRFILIKRTDANGDWVVFDSLRGIGSGNSPYLLLNDNQNSNANYDIVDPDSSGFIINQETSKNLNVNGGNYIFYAIA